MNGYSKQMDAQFIFITSFVSDGTIFIICNAFIILLYFYFTFVSGLCISFIVLWQHNFFFVMSRFNWKNLSKHFLKFILLVEVFFPFSDHVFLQFAPSLVAAGCVASSRIILRLSPTWPTHLQHLTTYTWEQLLPCVERLLLYVSGLSNQ